MKITKLLNFIFIAAAVMVSIASAAIDIGPEFEGLNLLQARTLGALDRHQPLVAVVPDVAVPAGWHLSHDARHADDHRGLRPHAGRKDLVADGQHLLLNLCRIGLRICSAASELHLNSSKGH